MTDSVMVSETQTSPRSSNLGEGALGVADFHAYFLSLGEALDVCPSDTDDVNQTLQHLGALGLKPQRSLHLL